MISPPKPITLDGVFFDPLLLPSVATPGRPSAPPPRPVGPSALSRLMPNAPAPPHTHASCACRRPPLHVKSSLHTVRWAPPVCIHRITGHRVAARYSLVATLGVHTGHTSGSGGTAACGLSRVTWLRSGRSGVAPGKFIPPSNTCDEYMAFQIFLSLVLSAPCDCQRLHPSSLPPQPSGAAGGPLGGGPRPPSWTRAMVLPPLPEGLEMTADRLAVNAGAVLAPWQRSPR